MTCSFFRRLSTLLLAVVVLAAVFAHAAPPASAQEEQSAAATVQVSNFDPYRKPERVNFVWVTIHDGSDRGNNHGGL